MFSLFFVPDGQKVGHNRWQEGERLNKAIHLSLKLICSAVGLGSFIFFICSLYIFSIFYKDLSSLRLLRIIPPFIYHIT